MTTTAKLQPSNYSQSGALKIESDVVFPVFINARNCFLEKTKKENGCRVSNAYNHFHLMIC